MINFSYLVIFTLFFSIQSRAELHFVDGQETHGGNVVLSEFWNIHNQVTAALSNCPREQTQPLVQQWLQQDIKTEVRTQEKVFIGANQEQEVVASNEPRRNPPLILISETRWPQLNGLEKLRITIHETLPILGTLDDDYVSSGKILDSFKACTTSRFSQKEISTAIGRCDQTFIAQLEGPEIFSLNLPQTMFDAAYAICGPALQKLQDFGGDIRRCAMPYFGYQLQSPLQGFIFHYTGKTTRDAKAYDFFMSHDRSELTSDCDRDFSAACTEIVSTNRVFPAAREPLKALGQKIGCPL